MEFRRLTPDERQRWERDGYFVIESALSEAEMVRIGAEIESCDLLSQEHGREPGNYLDLMHIVDGTIDRSNGNEPLLTEPNQLFIDLLDHDSHLGNPLRPHGGRRPRRYHPDHDPAGIGGAEESLVPHRHAGAGDGAFLCHSRISSPRIPENSCRPRSRPEADFLTLRTARGYLRGMPGSETVHPQKR